MSDDWTPREKRLMAWVHRLMGSLAVPGLPEQRFHIDESSRLYREAAWAERKHVCTFLRREDGADVCVGCGRTLLKKELHEAFNAAVAPIASERECPDSAAADMLFVSCGPGQGALVEPVGFTLAQVRELAKWYRSLDDMYGGHAAHDLLSPFLPLLTEAKDGK